MQPDRSLINWHQTFFWTRNDDSACWQTPDGVLLCLDMFCSFLEILKKISDFEMTVPERASESKGLSNSNSSLLAKGNFTEGLCHFWYLPVWKIGLLQKLCVEMTKFSACKLCLINQEKEEKKLVRDDSLEWKMQDRRDPTTLEQVSMIYVHLIQW